MTQIELLSKVNTAQQMMFSSFIDLLNDWGNVIHFQPSSFGFNVSFTINPIYPKKLVKHSSTNVILYYDECFKEKSINFYSLKTNDLIKLVTLFQMKKN